MTSKKLIYASITGCDCFVDMDAQQKHIHDLFVKNHQKGIVYESVFPHPRRGLSFNPMGIKNPPGFEMPDFVEFSDSFETVTDRRADEVAQLVSGNDLPIVVFWSGGIDSTSILASMIKNWDAALKSRLVVKMNNASYLENPWFFDKLIRGRIRYTNDPVQYSECYCISGNVADSIWVQADLLEFQSHFPDILKRNLTTEPDDLLAWLGSKTDADHARWLYDLILVNGRESGIELYDYEDFYWWMNFNFYYSGQHFKLLKQMQTKHLTPVDWQNYVSHNITWFHSRDYQLWSMNNRSNGVKYDGTVRSYKMPAKQYIFDVDNNQWYRDYKTKTGSGLLRPEFSSSKNQILVGLYENGEGLFSKGYALA